MGSTSKAFPAAVWPLNRSEAGIGCAALVPAGLAGSVALIPALSTPGDRRADAASVHWHPASFQHGLRTHGLLSEPRPPVTLRPPTRTPGFLKQAECPPYYRMVYNFRRAHGDLDIPHELLATAFQEAEADGGWDNIPSMKGGVVAVCRPALGDRWPPNPPPNAGETGGSAEDNLRGLRFKRDIKPALATRARAEGDDDDSEAASEPGVWSSRREWAMYASGECGNELWALPLPLPDDGAHAFPSLRRCGSAIPDATAAEVAPSIEFTTPIRQVAAHSSHPGAVCVRTDSMVAIVGLSQCHRGPNWTPYVSADVVGHPYSYDSGDRWTCHASWSPWRATEIALASGTGSVRLWDCAAGREVLLKDAEQAGSYDIQWNCCEFWNSPRHLLCANPDALYFLDARAGRTQTAIMSLPESPFALSGEAFTAICPSALHPLHAVAASTHAIRVFDQRYPKQPVMAWEHGSTPADPPIYLQSSRLPNYADGHAACILAATEKSSRIYCYVYGQGGSDQPYTSLDQSVLRPAAHASTVYETIQDALAIDPQRSEDMTSAYTHIAEYPTARLAGFSLSFMAPVDGTDAGVAGTRAPADSVCVSVDELGAVVGHHVVVAPSASTGNGFKAPASAHSGLLYSGVWNAAREVDGTIIDGMNLVLRERRSTDGTREATWAELRKRSEAYIRTDMSQAYRGLLEHVARAPPEIGYPPLSAAEGEALRRRIPSITSRDTSAYEVLCAPAARIASGATPDSGPLPALTSVQGMRRRLLCLGGRAGREGPEGLQVPDLVKAVCSDAASPAVDMHAAGREAAAALKGMFVHGAAPPSTLMQCALTRATEDVALANTRLRALSPAKRDCTQASSAGHSPAEPLVVCCTAPGVAGDGGLESRLGSLAGAARMLDDLWTAGPSSASSRGPHDERGDAGLRTLRAPKRRAAAAPSPGERATTPSQLPTPSHPQHDPGTAVADEAAPSAPVDVFAAASMRHLAQSARPRPHSSHPKSKARKRGF